MKISFSLEIDRKENKKRVDKKFKKNVNRTQIKVIFYHTLRVLSILGICFGFALIQTILTLLYLYAGLAAFILWYFGFKIMKKVGKYFSVKIFETEYNIRENNKIDFRKTLLKNGKRYEISEIFWRVYLKYLSKDYEFLQKRSEELSYPTATLDVSGGEFLDLRHVQNIISLFLLSKHGDISNKEDFISCFSIFRSNYYASKKTNILPSLPEWLA